MNLNKPEDDIICQICGCTISEDEGHVACHGQKNPRQERIVYCKNCGTPHHDDCWNLTGMCSTYGCNCTVSTDKKIPHLRNTSELIIIDESPVKSDVSHLTVDCSVPQRQRQGPFLTQDMSSLSPDLSGIESILASIFKAYALPATLLWKLLRYVGKRDEKVSLEGCLLGFFKEFFDVGICILIASIAGAIYAVGLQRQLFWYLLTAPVSYYLGEELSLSVPVGKTRKSREPLLLNPSGSGKRKRRRKSRKHKKSKKRNRH